MALSFGVGPQAVSAAEFVSASRNVPGGIQGASIALSACPEWDTATGFFSWGVEASFDGGTTWRLIVDQGYTDPHALAIGARTRSGGLPTLALGWDRSLPNARARIKAKTDGASLTCTFQVDTT